MTENVPSFDTPKLAEAVEQLPPGVVDQLPFGAIKLDRSGAVMFISQGERELSGRGDRPSIGLAFFTDIAPCMDNPASRGASTPPWPQASSTQNSCTWVILPTGTASCVFAPNPRLMAASGCFCSARRPKTPLKRVKLAYSPRPYSIVCYLNSSIVGQPQVGCPPAFTNPPWRAGLRPISAFRP